MTAPVKKAVIDMVCEAISEVGVSRKGASYPAIKKYVLEKYYTEENKGITTNLKKAIEKGLDKNILKRPAASKNAHGATGFFMLEQKTKGLAKKPRVNKATGPTETVSDSEVTINKGHPKIRRALSDTELNVTVKDKVLPSGKSMKKDKVVPSGKSMKDKVVPSGKSMKDKVVPSGKSMKDKVVPSGKSMKDKVVPSGKSMKDKVVPSGKLIKKDQVVPLGKSTGKPRTEKSEKKALYDPSSEVPLKETGTSVKGKPKAKTDPNVKVKTRKKN